MPSQSPLEIQHRIMRYNLTRELKEWVVLTLIWCSSAFDSVSPSLHETARISGNIITIPRVPYNLYVVIRNVIQKCCIDYCYHLRQANRRRSWEGTSQYRMPLPPHELFKGFVSKLLSQMWDGDSSTSFYPPRLAKMPALWGIRGLPVGTCFFLRLDIKHETS